MSKLDLSNFAVRDLLVMEKLLRVRDRRIDFAENHHRNTRGETMDFVQNPFLQAVYNTLARSIAIQGSVQSKKSEWIVIDHFAMAAEGLSVFFVLPKMEARTAYVQNRIDKRVQECPEYRRLLRAGSFDNTLMKNFGRGTIKYVGSNVLSDFKEFPGDALVVEEVDQCDQQNVDYGRDRLRGSIYQFRRYVGNPTMKGDGINRFYATSTQNVWHIPCPMCREPVELDWYKTVVKVRYDRDGNAVDYALLDSDWKRGLSRDVYVMCPKCIVPIDRLGKNGLWIPNRESDVEGFLMTMLNSWENSVTDMVIEFEAAWFDDSKMQHFVNSSLGLPYTSESSKLSESLLDRCSFVGEPYTFVSRRGCAHVENDRHNGPCSMGIDVGKKFDVRVSFPKEDGTRQAVFIGKVESLDEVIDIGMRYNVHCAVVDSMPEFHIVLDLMDRAPFHVWACRYASEGKDTRTKRDRKAKMITGDRTILLDKSLSKMKAGKNHLPVNFRSILRGSDGRSEYVDEMIESVRKEEVDKAGNRRVVWSKGKDHSRHADLYDYLASEMTEAASLSGVTVG